MAPRRHVTQTLHPSINATFRVQDPAVPSPNDPNPLPSSVWTSSPDLSPHHPNHHVNGAAAQIWGQGLRGTASGQLEQAALCGPGSPVWTGPASESPQLCSVFQSAFFKLSVRMTCFVSISSLLPTDKYNKIKINY